jgi:phenol 2-monooxygenase (NADPH)
MRDLHKTFVDEESYNSGHGHCYEHFGISTEGGVCIITRPDNYVSMIVDMDDHERIGRFFGGVFKKVAAVNGHK